MIFGTAGHIDHGKTSLVKALTGVDADRLAEEKRRGITIDLGYAYCETSNGSMLGFVDVPGHEKFVHNMLAGVTGIEHALLVVAADDGIMPQTREHLAVLQLLGVRTGTVVISKIDRVDAGRLQELAGHLRPLLADTFLEDAPIFKVSSPHGVGIVELREHLFSLCRDAGPDASDASLADGFRMAIDRVFTLTGVGTVATGTVHSGMVSVGDTLRLAPRGLEVKVRGLHAQNRVASVASAGQRCALNLSGDGLERSKVHRGDWLTAHWLQRASNRFDAQVQALNELRSPLGAWMPAHLHLGAADVMCRILPLSVAQIEAGQQAWVQVVCDDEIHVCAGDRFVLRNQGANQTLAGGIVVDTVAPQRRRRTPQRLAQLEVLSRGDVAERLLAVVRLAQAEVSLPRLSAQWNVDERTLFRHALARSEFVCKLLSRGAHGQSSSLPDIAAGSERSTNRLPDRLQDRSQGGSQDRSADSVEFRPGDHWLVWHRDLWSSLARKVIESLGDFHRQFADEQGCERDRLRRMAMPEMDHQAARLLLQCLIDQGEIQATGVWLHLPDHRIRLSEAEAKFRDQVLLMLGEAGLEPPWVRDLARATALDEPRVRGYLLRLVRNGDVHQVVRDLFFSNEALARLTANAKALQLAEGKVTAARFRDETGLSRKRAIQVLEYFDRVGISRRVRDVHFVREQYLI